VQNRPEFLQVDEKALWFSDRLGKSLLNAALHTTSLRKAALMGDWNAREQGESPERDGRCHVAAYIVEETRSTIQPAFGRAATSLAYLRWLRFSRRISPV